MGLVGNFDEKTKQQHLVIPSVGFFLVIHVSTNGKLVVWIPGIPFMIGIVALG